MKHAPAIVVGLWWLGMMAALVHKQAVAQVIEVLVLLSSWVLLQPASVARVVEVHVCEAIDTDGDKRLSYFSLGSDGKVTRENVTGTGKFEGMVATGTVKPLGPFPVVKAGTFQDCNHQTGTYKLK